MNLLNKVNRLEKAMLRRQQARVQPVVLLDTQSDEFLALTGPERRRRLIDVLQKTGNFAKGELLDVDSAEFRTSPIEERLRRLGEANKALSAQRAERPSLTSTSRIMVFAYAKILPRLSITRRRSSVVAAI